MLFSYYVSDFVCLVLGGMVKLLLLAGRFIFHPNNCFDFRTCIRTRLSNFPICKALQLCKNQVLSKRVQKSTEEVRIYFPCLLSDAGFVRNDLLLDFIIYLTRRLGYSIKHIPLAEAHFSITINNRLLNGATNVAPFFLFQKTLTLRYKMMYNNLKQ